MHAFSNTHARAHAFLALAALAAVARVAIQADAAAIARGVDLSGSGSGSGDGSAAEAGPQCADEREECGGWATNQECIRNPLYMGSACPVSCNTCDEWLAAQGTQPGCVCCHFRVAPSCGRCAVLRPRRCACHMRES